MLCGVIRCITPRIVKLVQHVMHMNDGGYPSSSTNGIMNNGSNSTSRRRNNCRGCTISARSGSSNNSSLNITSST